MKIYTANTDFLLDDNKSKKYLACVSEYRRKKVLRLRFPKDQALSLGAGLLLKLALSEIGIDEKTVTYKTGEHGKPYIEGEQYSFSLSHSGNRVALIVDDMVFEQLTHVFGSDVSGSDVSGSDNGQVYQSGIDIELVQSYAENIVKRFFTSEEQNGLLELKERDPKEAERQFARLWTRRESLGKLTGRGLDFTDLLQKRVSDEAYMCSMGYYFRERTICDEGTECEYFITACSRNIAVRNTDVIVIDDLEECI